MKKILLFILIALSITACFHSHVLKQAPVVNYEHLFLSGVENNRIISRLHTLPWKYHPGDSLHFAHIDYPDSSWKTLCPLLRTQDLLSKNWSGSGWFRLKITADKNYSVTNAALNGIHLGNIEIFWDGQKVSDFLSRRPFSFYLDPGKTHLLAIRYKKQSLTEAQQRFGFAGIQLNLLNYEKQLTFIDRQRSEQMIFTSLPLAFALVHLILFIFLPSARANLYYALMLIFSAIATYADIEHVYLAKIADSFFYLSIHRFFVPLTSILFLRFVYAVIYTFTPKQFWAFSFAHVAIIVLLIIEPGELYHYYVLLTLLVNLEVARAIIVAIRRNQKSISILAIGLATLFIFGLYDALLDLELIHAFGEITNAYYFGSIGLFLSMSVFLGRDFARSNKKIIEQEQLAEKLALERKLLEAEDTRKSDELEKARQLQLSMLPQCLNDIPGLDICFHMTPASEVGGDYYDFKHNDGTLTVAVGDATGHGMKAGMMVSVIKSLFVADIEQCELLPFLDKVSATIKQMKLGNMYMALQLLRIKNNKVELTSAGMPPVFIFRNKTKNVEEILLKATPLGAPISNPYKTIETSVDKDDIILLMTDGFAEQFNPQKEMLDFPVIKEKLLEFSKLSATQIIESLKSFGKEWMAGEQQGDDITFVAIKIRTD